MNDELRRLLCKYVDNNMFADYNFVKGVINIFIKFYGNNGLKKVIIINEEQKGISDFDNSIIGINLDYIKKETINYSWYDDVKSNLYLFNISVILVLKHEFNHFRQVVRYKRVINSDDFLDKLFVNSFIMACFSDMKFINLYNETDYNGNEMMLDKIYREYHDCFVVERLAQIDAYKNILEIMVPMREKLKQVYYYYLYEYYLYKVKDYRLIDDIVLSPVDKILFMMNDYFQYQDNKILNSSCDGDIDDFYDSIIDDYNVNDRFIYGLPITVNEYMDSMDFIKLMYILGGSNLDGIKIKKRYFDRKGNQ